jgi:polysaccharide deacetylase family protein (PEP-CTERM system associated)
LLNALTVDVEDWYMTSDFDYPQDTWEQFEDRVVPSTMRLLDLFDRYQAKGTFFVLGCVADRHPGLIMEIDRRGHEIGSHGYWHRMLTRMTADEFRADLRASKETLERIVKKPVVLFRAPSWSVSADRYEYLRIMQEEGFLCDSSLQPFHTPLSGVSGAPVEPFVPVVDGEALQLVEFPPTVWKLGAWTMPFSGGFYLRALPYPLIRHALKRVNRSRPGMIYVHPWEIDLGQPRMRASVLTRLSHYYRLETTYRKLERLLGEFAFATLGEILHEGQADYPRIVLKASAKAQRTEGSSLSC